MHSSPADPVTQSPLITRPPSEIFERLEAQITELWGHLNAATYRFLVLVAEFDRHEGYARHVLPSTAHWLNWQCGIGMIAAREKVRVARALKPSRDPRGVRERRVLLFEGARDDARRDARERSRAREHRAPRHGVARREARAQIPLDAAARRGENGAVAAPEPFGALVLRPERYLRAECAVAAGDRRARRTSAPSGGGRAARAALAR